MKPGTATQRKNVGSDKNTKSTNKSANKNRIEAKSSTLIESSESESASLKTRPPATLSEASAELSGDVSSEENRAKYSVTSSTTSSAQQARKSGTSSKANNEKIASTDKPRIVRRNIDSRPVHRDDDSEESGDSSQEHGHNDKSQSQKRPPNRPPEKSASAGSLQRDASSTLKPSAKSSPQEHLADESSDSSSESSSHEKKTSAEIARPISATTRKAPSQTPTADKRARFHANKNAKFTQDSLATVKTLRAAATKDALSEIQSGSKSHPVLRKGALAQAIEEGNVAAAGALIRAGCNVNEVDGNGDTPLAIATAVGNADMMTVLIRAGADIDGMDAHGATSLARATKSGFTQIAALLLQAGASVDAVDGDGYTSLMLAAESGNEELIALLISARPNDSLTNRRNGYTALELTARSGNTEATRLLINVPRLFRGNDLPAFYRALEAGQLQTVQYWLKALPGIMSSGRGDELLELTKAHKSIYDLMLADGEAPATHTTVFLLDDFRKAARRSQWTFGLLYRHFISNHFRYPVAYALGETVADTAEPYSLLLENIRTTISAIPSIDPWLLFHSCVVATSPQLHALCNDDDALMGFYSDLDPATATKLRGEAKEQASQCIASGEAGLGDFRLCVSNLAVYLQGCGVIAQQQVVINLCTNQAFHPTLAKLVAKAWDDVPTELRSATISGGSGQGVAASLARTLQIAMMSDDFLNLLDATAEMPLLQNFVTMQVNALQSFCMLTLLEPHVDPAPLAAMVDIVNSGTGKSFREAALDLGIGAENFDRWTQPQ